MGGKIDVMISKSTEYGSRAADLSEGNWETEYPDERRR